MRTYRLWWGTTALILVAIGLPLAMARLGVAQVLAVGIPMAGIGALYAYLYAAEDGGGPAWICAWAARAGVGVPAAVGLLAPLGPGGLVPILLFLVAAPRCVAWFQHRYGEFAAQGLPSRPAFASRISDHDLSLAWESSYLALQQATDLATKARIVRVRTALLDELDRRSSPTGRSRRWVASPDQLYAARAPQRH
ncbi:hypothetical protein [Nocardioides panaciterrulae]|uniref:Uncharacterized protein n=1 Tax=Nocardioides panaciterrulae TaxID=661492 RepID=A0A7Y9E5A7_9ACTN|nr:hypothetical protein [Nocardioides panaciterrulae]NYD41192.1 hypothetical protein [Nocardioides panaciterrulae]